MAVNIVLVYLAGFIGLQFILMLIFGMMIVKTIGFDGLSKYFKVFKGRKKGLVLGRVYKEEGTSDYVVLKKKSSRVLQGVVNKGDSESAFILKDAFVYHNEMGLPCCDFFEKDIEPRDWKCAREYVTAPQTFNNIWLNAVKSEQSFKSLLDYLKHPVVKLILVCLAVAFGAMLFMLINQNEQIITLSQQVATNKVVVG